MILKHYHENEVRKMVKAPEETVNQSDDEKLKRTHSKRTIEDRTDAC
jgi:hypothetical protein